MSNPDKTDTELAAIIHRYWLSRGYVVNVRGSRSDLVCGLPADYRAVNGEDLAVSTRASATDPRAEGARPALSVDRGRAPAVAAEGRT